MLPHLPETNGAPPRSVQVPPPPKFRAPLGVIHHVEIHEGSQESQKGTSAAQRAGLSYESRVQRELVKQFSTRYRRSPEIHFCDDRGHRTCIPDGLLILSSQVCVIEIKSQHMPEAWWQLRKLYGPVVAACFGGTPKLLEICRVYDPHTPFPEQPTLIEGMDIAPFLRDKHATFGVLRWKL